MTRNNNGSALKDIKSSFTSVLDTYKKVSLFKYSKPTETDESLRTIV